MIECTVDSLPFIVRSIARPLIVVPLEFVHSLLSIEVLLGSHHHILLCGEVLDIVGTL